MAISPEISGGMGYLRPRRLRYLSQDITGASTTVVSATTGHKILVGYIHFSNHGSSNCQEIALKFSGSATKYFRTYLPAYGGTVVFNLIQAELDEGATGDSLEVIMDTTNSPNVYVTLGYLTYGAV